MCLEISLRVISAEVLPDPVIPRSHLVLLLAVQGEGIVVEGLVEEHGVGPVRARHSHLVAGQDVPPESIQIPGRISVIEVCAVRIRRIIEEVNVDSL